MSDWLSGDVAVGGVRLRYHRTGGDKPSLVLCHGFSDNGLCWSRVAHDLEADYDIIMYDARGHGESEAPESGYDDETRAADLAGLVGALGLRRPRVWGHSMGAATAAKAAASNPELLSCVVLEDPPWWSKQEQARRDRARSREGLPQWLVQLQGMSREELVAACRKENPDWHEEELGPWADSKLQIRLRGQGALRRTASHWSEWVGSIGCPILLLAAGSTRGSIVTPEVASEAAALWRQGRVATIPDAGHSIHRGNYGGAMAVVKPFLAENRQT